MGRTNVRVSALVFREKEILLFHRFRAGDEYWVVPGGGVEEGETSEQALERELMEETSLRLISCQHVFDVNSSIQGNLLISHFYVCITQGEPTLGDGPEKQTDSESNRYILTWVPVNNVDKLISLYPPAASEIKNLFEKNTHK